MKSKVSHLELNQVLQRVKLTQWCPDIQKKLSWRAVKCDVLNKAIQRNEESHFLRADLSSCQSNKNYTKKDHILF